MSLTLASLKQDAKKVAGRACEDPGWDKNVRVQYIRMEGGLIRRTLLKKALRVLKDRSHLCIYVAHSNPPKLVFSWSNDAYNIGTLRLRLWEDSELSNWKAA